MTMPAQFPARQQRGLAKFIKLALDFSANEVLDPRITFSRTSNATRVNAQGLIETVAINQPRFDYDPVTLAPKGLLIEEQRINILLNSDTLSTQSVSVTAQTYTLSFYGTGSVALSGAYTGSLVGAGAYPNRVQLTFTPTIGTLTLTVTGSVRYANLEAGAFPTSYIPTTSAQVTRTADNASMTGTNFSSWYNQSEGTLVVGFDMYNATTISGAFPRVISISNGTNANLIDLQSRQYANEDFSVTDTAVAQCTITLGQFAANTFGKLAGAYQVNNFQAAANGVLGTADLAGTVPTVNQLQLGNRWDMLRPMSGHIKSFKFFNKRLLNSYLQSLTQ